MRFSVSVPVLSEQMTVTEPRVSTAGSLRIRAFRRSMRCAPKARAMVTTAGKPLGHCSDRHADRGQEHGGAGPRRAADQ